MGPYSQGLGIKSTSKNCAYCLEVVAQAFNPSTLGGGGRWISVSRTARATQRNYILKKQKPNQSNKQTKKLCGLSVYGAEERGLSLQIKISLDHITISHSNENKSRKQDKTSKLLEHNLKLIQENINDLKILKKSPTSRVILQGRL